MNNLILIGMPGAGKSTIGILLAKAIGYQFIDTDLMIQEQEKELLQETINKKGLKKFLSIEENIISKLNIKNTVIATGGSAVYSDKAMRHLKKIGRIIYLRLPVHIIEERVGNITTRGVVMKKGETIKALFEKRYPLYDKYADYIIDTEGLSIEKTVEHIVILQ